MKPVVFLGDSLNVLRGFPDRARRSAGYQLDRVQRGLEPDDWKPMASIGVGVREIRVRDASGAFRIVYVAHCPRPFTCCTRSRRRLSGRRHVTSAWRKID